MSDKKQIAEALRLAATYLGSGLHDNAVESLQRQANALDPPYKVDRTLQPGEVAVSILPTSEWPRGCEFIRIVLLFESATGRTLHESFERIFDRKDAERMEAEND